MRNPPTLLSLAIDSAVINFCRISDLSFVPEHILLELFVGKVFLRFFIKVVQSDCIRDVTATGTIEVEIVNPERMSQVIIKDDEVDIVIGALQSDLTSFMEAWRPMFSRFHLIIVKDPDLKEELKIPGGFNLNLYTKSDMDKVVGLSSTKDSKGELTDAVAQHITNLTTPATPFFFNTLYDPFSEGTDFVRGYPFSLRSGVECGLSCGLWLNLADYDAPTQALKPSARNSRYVDAVLTVPARAMLPLSGINIAFNNELIGPALLPAFRLAKEGKFRWETVEDIWTGMCAKVVCDHLRLGVKSGLPYVWRQERGSAVESLKKEWEGVQLMEEVVPFFQSVRLSEAAVTAEDCVAEIAASVTEQLGRANPMFARAAEIMVEWIKLWKQVRSQ
ncbi:putative UDP-arabinopyranose mutase 5 [Sesamum angolense]|uniref:UDP-arabinopyranose mutase 5 n=1 Tax=Sesamum angolense TaxID=2727404 RepID=A0AAE2BZS9_9LAMI|nr:putative UDP-arabinopyranose mutase 5 [Sesamum angolense]